MFEVLEPNWQILEERLKKVTTVDEVLKHHNDFLDTCLKECMLTNNGLLQIMTNLMLTCQEFAQFSEIFTQVLDNHTSLRATQKVTDPCNSPHKIRKTRFEKVSTEVQKFISNKDYSSFIKKFDANFKQNLKLLMDALYSISSAEANKHVENLILRLDYNQFYKQYLG